MISRLPLVLLITSLVGSAKDAEQAPAQSPPAQSGKAESPAKPPSSGPDEAVPPGYVSFPSSGVKLLKPEGFEKADGFDGFGRREDVASVMIVSIPGPSAQVVAVFSEENLKKRGWTLLSQEAVKVDGRPGKLIQFQQPAGGIDFLKWSLIFGDARKTTLVTATFPKDKELEFSDRLKATLLSTRLDSTKPPAPGTDLPFTLTASPKLKLSPGLNKMIVYTKDGEVEAKSPKDPLFIAAPSFGKVDTRNRRQFAERRLGQVAETKGIAITLTAPIIVDGLDGFESIAKGKDAKSGTPLDIYQVMLFDGGSYILIQGLVGEEYSDDYLHEFKVMARSLKKK